MRKHALTGGVIACALSFLSAGCQSAPVAASPDGSTVPSPNGWQPGEVAINKVSQTQGLYSYKEGRAPGGSYYTNWGDGTASVSRTKVVDTSPDWKVSCSVDKMNDRRNCNITSGRTPLYIDYGSSQTPREVCLLGHDFPGRTGMIRAGSGKPISTNEAGCVAASRVMPALLAAKTISTRKVHWPYDENNDESGDLVGLTDAMSMLKYLREHP